jgi:hypothetical protein
VIWAFKEEWEFNEWLHDQTGLAGDGRAGDAEILSRRP